MLDRIINSYHLEIQVDWQKVSKFKKKTLNKKIRICVNARSLQFLKLFYLKAIKIL